MSPGRGGSSSADTAGPDHVSQGEGSAPQPRLRLSPQIMVADTDSPSARKASGGGAGVGDCSALTSELLVLFHLWNMVPVVIDFLRRLF